MGRGQREKERDEKKSTAENVNFRNVTLSVLEVQGRLLRFSIDTLRLFRRQKDQQPWCSEGTKW